MREIVSSDKAPKAVGPYSQAVRMGKLVFLSGQIPLDPSTNQLVEGSIQVQTERALENMRAVLAAAGLTFDHVAKVTVFLKSLTEFVAMNEVYARYFPHNPPARSTVEVARLPRDVSIEIDAIAVAP